MEEVRIHLSPSPNCVLRGSRAAAGLIIAVPFVVCFSLFGLFNVVGGAMLLGLSCGRLDLNPRTVQLLKRLRQTNDNDIVDNIDPMQVVGILLLLTGFLLVLIGLTLGWVACRSVDSPQGSGASRPTLLQTHSRRSSNTSRSGRNNCRKKSQEKTVSPIMEADSEEESGR